MFRAIWVMMAAWVFGIQAQYPATTKEWDFMIETGQDVADVNGGIPLQKGGVLPALNGKGNWREPVITALGWSFEGEEVACIGPHQTINMGDTWSTHMWIYVYDFSSRQTVW